MIELTPEVLKLQVIKAALHKKMVKMGKICLNFKSKASKVCKINLFLSKNWAGAVGGGHTKISSGKP